MKHQLYRDAVLIWVIAVMLSAIIGAASGAAVGVYFTIKYWQ
jgi:hypothetical protein